MHFRIAFSVLVLGRTERMNQRGIDDGCLSKRQATGAKIAIDNAESTSGQLVLFQQATEVEDGSFILDPLQAQTGKLAQDRRLLQRFFHRRIAVTEPVPHEMNPQHRHQSIGRTTTFALRVMRFDQRNQTPSR